MGKINVLGFDVANLIAAGEVVDRPSSAVKELLENAIDSGATSITVEIKNGGTSFIRITDNGCGMDFDDLPVAILRHATSKIKNASDLDAVFTLGFRGEALAAISSVSKIRIMSKQKTDDLGGLLECHGGKVISHIKTGCANGTTVIVEDLFYNVPARKKFLKKDVTEAIAVTSVVEKIAMSEPGIAFRYIIDGNIKYITSGDGSLQNVIYAILGRDVAKKLIKVSREDGGVSVEGLISSPDFVRSNRNFENFYINSRFVKSKTASAAIEQAYQSYIPSDKFPFCVLNIKIDPATVDVNVHPSKLEVKFSNEKIIFDAVYYAVKTVLSSSINRPSLYDEDANTYHRGTLANTPFKAVSPEERPDRIVFDKNSNFGVVMSGGKLNYDIAKSTQPNTEGKKPTHFEISEQKDRYCPPGVDNSVFPKTENKTVYNVSDFMKKEGDVSQKSENTTTFTQYKAQPSEVQPIKRENKTVPEYKMIGEAFNSYVIVEMGDTLYMIDKHAAHERIIFEDLKQKIKLAEHSSQMLLIPIEVHLATEEKASLCEWGDDIKKTGFGYEVKENGTVSIYEIPAGIEPQAAEDMFVTFASALAFGEGDAKKTRDEFFEKALYQASCKAAIKAGRVYEEEHIKWICDRVLSLDNIKYCPHGRPVAFEITKHFLEKQFERIK